MKNVIVGKPFNGAHFSALDIARIGYARACCDAINDTSAGTANADAAAKFCALQVEVFAKKIEQRLVGPLLRDVLYLTVQNDWKRGSCRWLRIRS